MFRIMILFGMLIKSCYFCWICFDDVVGVMQFVCLGLDMELQVMVLQFCWVEVKVEQEFFMSKKYMMFNVSIIDIRCFIVVGVDWYLGWYVLCKIVVCIMMLLLFDDYFYLVNLLWFVWELWGCILGVC